MFLAIVILACITAYCLYFGFRTKLYIANGNNMVHTTKPYSRDGSDESILILGDSLAYGVGTSSPETSFAGRIGARYPNASIVNNAKVGEDINELAELLPQQLNRNYDIIFVIVGGNDISHYGIDLNNSKKDLAKIYKDVAKHSQQAYMYTSVDFSRVSAIPSVFKKFYSNRSQTIRTESQRLASQYPNVTYVDTFNKDPKQYSTLQATDGFHLNDHGVNELIKQTFKD